MVEVEDGSVLLHRSVSSHCSCVVVSDNDNGRSALGAMDLSIYSLGHFDPLTGSILWLPSGDDDAEKARAGLASRAQVHPRQS